jgi:hypothetical protein
MNMISMLMVGIPLAAMAVSIRYAARHPAKTENSADVKRRFAHGLWIANGHG